MEKPTISNDGAVTQAGATIKQYLHQAREAIDEVFGRGHARAHPDLVGACVQAQAADFNAALQAAALFELAESTRDVSSMLSDFPDAIVSAGIDSNR